MTFFRTSIISVIPLLPDHHQIYENYIKTKKFQIIKISDTGLVQKFWTSVNFKTVIINFISSRKLKILIILDNNKSKNPNFWPQKNIQWDHRFRCFVKFFYLKLKKMKMNLKWSSFTLTSLNVCVFLQNVLRISPQDYWW